jgi:phosphoglycolate phosphatase
MPTPTGFIFDLDGTLVDTIADITASVNHAIAQVRPAGRSAVEIRAMVGDGVGMLMREATGVEDDRAIAELVERFRTHYGDHYLDETKLYPGWVATLDALTAAGAPLAVLSNKPHEFTRRICAELLAPWPVVEAEGQRDGVPMKPDPARAIALCAMMDRRPDEVYFVGDSSHDIETARRGGMISVAVTWGYRPADVLAAHGPDHMIDHPADLLRLLPVVP